MVANEEGEWRELEPGPPLPHFLLGLHTRLWKELGDGSWAHAGGRALLAGESQGPLCSELGVRAEGTLVPAPSPFSPPRKRSGNSLVRNIPLTSRNLLGSPAFAPLPPVGMIQFAAGTASLNPRAEAWRLALVGPGSPSVRTFCRSQEQTLPRKAGESLSCFLRGWEGAGGEAQRKSSQLGVCPPFLRPAVEGGGYLLEAFPDRCTGELPRSP